MKNYCSSVSALLSTAILIATAFSLVSCRSLENQSVENPPSFRLVFLDSSKIPWPKGHINYTWDTLWPLLKQAYPSAVAYSIEDVDIESYNWTQQVITLTPKASKTLLDTFDCSGVDRINPYFCLAKYRFLVVLNNLPIYGGDFAEIGSAMVRQYPVINISVVQNQIVFTIAGKPLPGKSSPIWDIIEDDRIKTVFLGLGKLIK